MGGHQEGCQSPKAEWVKDKGQGETQGARPRNWDSDLLKDLKKDMDKNLYKGYITIKIKDWSSWRSS